MHSTRQNVRNDEYMTLLGRLPREIQEEADVAFRLFEDNPSHPSLRSHPLKNKGRRHVLGSVSVSINMDYRAVYFVDETTGGNNVWFWIGSHKSFDKEFG